MNRKIVFFATAALMVVGGNNAGAQLPLKFGIAAGVSAPAGDMSKITNTGYNITLLTETKFPVIPFALRFEGALNQFGFDKDKVALDGNARSLSLNANGIFDVPVSTLLKFYAIGGVGVYRLRAATDVGGGSFNTTSENKFGFNVGGGIRLPLVGFEAFLEARYHNAIDTNGFTFVPVTFGVKF